MTKIEEASVRSSHGSQESFTLHLEGEIEEDIPAELDSFAKCSRLGLYPTACEIYDAVLEKHLEWFPIPAEYAAMLLAKGDYGALEQYIEVITKDQKRFSNYQADEMGLFTLYLALAKMYNDGLMDEAILEAARTLSLVKSSSVAMLSDVQIQIQILRFRIYETASGCRLPAFHSWFHGPSPMSIKETDFKLPWNGDNIHVWQGYMDWFEHLQSNNHEWDAQTVLGLYCRNAPLAQINFSSHAILGDLPKKSTETSLLIRFALSSIMFSSLAYRIWNDAGLLDIRLFDYTGEYVRDMELVRDQMQNVLIPPLQGETESQAKRTQPDVPFPQSPSLARIYSSTHSPPLTRICHLITLYKVDHLTMSAMRRLRNLAIPDGWSMDLRKVLEWSRCNSDYELWFEAILRMRLLSDDSEMSALIRSEHQGWREKNDSTLLIFCTIEPLDYLLDSGRYLRRQPRKFYWGAEYVMDALSSLPEQTGTKKDPLADYAAAYPPRPSALPKTAAYLQPSNTYLQPPIPPPNKIPTMDEPIVEATDSSGATRDDDKHADPYSLKQDIS